MFYNFPGAPGNTAYNSQANPNPLMARDPSFQIPQRGIRGMSPAELEEAIKWDPKSEQQLRDLNRGIKPGGPLPFPFAVNPTSGTPMGNVGFFERPQYAQQMPAGFQNKMVS